MLGAYVAQRVQPFSALTLEAGVRYDDASYVNDGDVSPRFNLAWHPLARTTVRGAWGRYAQSPAIFALSVGDRQTQFWPSEHAEHRGVGIEQELTPGTSLRVEAYQRQVERPRPRFINAASHLAVFPEVENDRIRLDPTSSRAVGVEAFLQRMGSRHVEWSLSYALARMTDRLNGVDVPRDVDQRHTVAFDWSYRPTSNRWRFSIAAHAHTGWPTTSSTFKVDSLTDASTGAKTYYVTTSYGVLNADRLPRYQRIDVRYVRYFETRRGRFSFYTDVFNLLNRHNARGYDYSVYVRPVRVTRNYDTFLPRLPSAGLTWEF
jgi:hypothetical protein